MRLLPSLVLAESVGVVVLGLAWLASESEHSSLSGDSAPSADTADAAPLTNAAARPDVADKSPRRTEAGGEWPAGSSSIVVQGRVLVPDGGMAPTDARITFRLGRTWAGVTVLGERYAACGLRPGEWTVSATADGCFLPPTPHVVGTQALQHFDLQLQRSQRVKVWLRTPDGASLEEAIGKSAGSGMYRLHVVVTAQPLTGDLPLTEHSGLGDLAGGRYTSKRDLNLDKKPDEPDGEILIDGRPPVQAALLLRHLLLAQEPISAGQDAVTFTVDPAMVRGRMATVRARLLDGVTGQPMPEARAGLHSAQGGGIGNNADANGVVVMENVMPGLLTLQVGVKDRESITWLVRVPAGGTLDLGDLTLQPAVKLRGSVVDPDGKPSPASVRWTDLDAMTFPRELVQRYSTLADGDGNFEIGSTGPHRYLVMANQEGRLGMAIVDASRGEPGPVQIRLAQPVTVALAVGGDALRGYVVTVRNAEGVPVAAVRIEHRWRDRASLAVLPGDYTLEVHDAGDRLLKKVPLQVRDATVTVAVP